MSRLFIHKYKYKYTSSFLIAINYTMISMAQ